MHGWEIGSEVRGGETGSSHSSTATILQHDGDLFGLIVHGLLGEGMGRLAADSAAGAMLSSLVAMSAPDADPRVKNARKRLTAAFEAGDRALRRMRGATLPGGLEPSGDPGAVAVALLWWDGFATIAHVGDCRAYRARDGSVEALTCDHSMEVPGFGPVLVRVLGCDDPPPTPDVARHVVASGDAFLLCSPRLARAIAGIDLAPRMLDPRVSAEQACAAIVSAGLETLGPEAGGSALLVRCRACYP